MTGDSEDDGPFKAALERANARPISISKSLEDLASTPSRKLSPFPAIRFVDLFIQDNGKSFLVFGIILAVTDLVQPCKNDGLSPSVGHFFKCFNVCPQRCIIIIDTVSQAFLLSAVFCFTS